MVFFKKIIKNDKIKKNITYIKLFIILFHIFIILISRTLLIIVSNMPFNENIDIKKFFKLQNKAIEPNNPLLLKEKKNLLELMSNNSGHKITNVETLFFGANFRFGNQILIISKSIFFCEILGCKRLILDKKNWFIKNKIYYKKFNMTIQLGKKFDFENKHTVFDMSSNWLYYFSYIKPELRIDILKQEILNNVPKIITNPEELFIHIRSGDIFKEKKKHNSFYSQPPLCFYQRILQEYKFKKVYIISENRMNPIIDNLIKNYNNIIFSENTIKIDIAYIIYAYNIVGSISTFINVLIRLNDNLKYFWEYDLPSLVSKILHCHHSFYKLKRNITYYRMEPSENYKKIMCIWKRNLTQLELMLNEKCENIFYIIIL